MIDYEKRAMIEAEDKYTFRQSVAVLLEEIPFVDHDDAALAVPLDEIEDVHVLGLHSGGGVNHHYADVAVLDGPDGTHHGIEFEILLYLVLLPDAGRVHEHELVPELIVIR